MADIQTIVLTPTDPVPLHNLVSALSNLLPYTLPLLRRTQHTLLHPTPTTHVTIHFAAFSRRLTTLSISTSSLLSEFLDYHFPRKSSSIIVRPWLISHTNLTTPGQTQSWLYASWERPYSPIPSTDHEFCQRLLNNLFSYVTTTLVPSQPTQPPSSWTWLRDTGKIVSQPYSQSKVIFGTVNDVIRPFLPRMAITRGDANYDKWVFSPDIAPQPEDQIALPEGYTFGELSERQLAIVLERSVIPRTMETMKGLGSVGVFYKGDAVGWGFVSKDGSLSSLHTEVGHRGRGLAVGVARELMRRSEGWFDVSKEVALGGQKGDRWVHADVSEDNIGSGRVMEKLGGRKMWRVSWIEMDLSKLNLTPEESYGYRQASVQT